MSKYLLVIFIIFFVSLKSHSYELTGMRLKDNPPSMTFTICPNYSKENASKIIKRAAKQWRYLGVLINFTYDYCIGDDNFPLASANGVSRVDFGNIKSGKRVAEASIYSIKSIINECDIRFSSTANWNTSTKLPDGTEFDLYSVALHEFGHCIGLDHSHVAGSVMYDTSISGSYQRVLTDDEKAGIQVIYKSTNQ